MKKSKQNIYKHSSPAAFAQKISKGKWTLAPHLEFINEILLKASNKEIIRIIINMPPRHGKSELISKYFPAWYLGNFPDRNIILASYEERFAASWGRKVRDIIREYGREYFDIEINPKASSSASFAIAGHSGGMDCSGVDGAITGKGADLLLIDDPVKNNTDAGSSVCRSNIWDWFLSTAYTRLEPEGVVVIIMTRWHEDDLCGRLLSAPNINVIIPKYDCEKHQIIIPKSQNFNVRSLNEDVRGLNEELEGNVDFESYIAYHSTNEDDYDSETWYLLNLPAISGDNDALLRKPGEALWKERYSIKKLENKKRTLGSYRFSALYQQTPTPAEGGIFKRKHFRYFHEDDEFYYLSADNRKITYNKNDCSVFATVDLAISTKETADYTVVLVFALTPKKEILVLDIIRERFEGTEHLGLLHSVYEKWKPGIIGIECVQYQTTLVKQALQEGLPASALVPDKNKITRALPVSARMESGYVYFLSKAGWLGSFEEELLNFPNSRHDDQVDAFAYAAVLIQPESKSRPAGSKSKRNQKEKEELALY